MLQLIDIFENELLRNIRLSDDRTQRCYDLNAERLVIKKDPYNWSPACLLEERTTPLGARPAFL